MAQAGEKNLQKNSIEKLALDSRPKLDRCLSGPGEVESSAGMRGGNRARYLLETRRGPLPQVQLTFQVVAAAAPRLLRPCGLGSPVECLVLRDPWHERQRLRNAHDDAREEPWASSRGKYIKGVHVPACHWSQALGDRQTLPCLSIVLPRSTSIDHSSSSSTSPTPSLSSSCCCIAPPTSCPVLSTYLPACYYLPIFGTSPDKNPRPRALLLINNKPALLVSGTGNETTSHQTRNAPSSELPSSGRMAVLKGLPTTPLQL
ncbi:predicted protein [Verticillium alfalfae VaMs.102]|uniref:Predicted protein n=1 Tax=Verticillium alfalfae (strain VaMs.102 / ATCC MYA-4576 / FGSC 10136) TaxID=526221 RepID=C9SP26_VERA1|nr:predicted protein [Verticillium alfalfae VaMs.102]EEY20541.1 predicted protein [Verticillium alfalfae VaMs.102]